MNRNVNQKESTMKTTTRKIQTANGTENLTYEQVCDRLGMRSEIHFVEVTSRGTIAFTLGRPDEIKALHRACKQAGLRPAKSLTRAIDKMYSLVY